MSKCLLLALAASALHAAVIRGVVVENQTGKPLARTLVVMQPVAGTPGPALSTRTNLYGAFEFPPVPAGGYLVSTSRGGFAPSQYGQKNFKSAGVPILLEDAAAAFLDIRLKRFGAIGGTIEDENLVGLPEHEVVAYHNTRPPKLAARAKADDRGVFRISGLEPGIYVVRTVARQYEEGGYLPTFFKEIAVVEQAQTVEVRLDEQTDNVNVKPFPGRLLNIAGRVSKPATVTLVSDMGREIVVTSDTFKFNPVAPGQYELFAVTQDQWAAYQPLAMELDQTDIRITLRPYEPTGLTFRSTAGQLVDSTTVQVLARRKDLAGDDDPKTLRPAGGGAVLTPGRWDVALVPSPSWYVSGFFSTGSRGITPPARPDGWNEFVVGGRQDSVSFTLSPSPGAIHGTVSTSGHDPVAGVKVFLEATDLDPRKRVLDIRTARTDMRGQYQFVGLAPGSYRLLATFEYQTADSSVMETAGARGVKAEEARDLQQDLDLYVIR
ncbi:MAG TPA: carboxypeptidase-like regulatory domain-containing protein [Bryobacteraceae bacterium]|nr:carboxypeptidase-like regulatory domain-containing protein [Bryobacteraceae bacterium]